MPAKRVTPDRQEDHRPQRHQQHVADLAGRVGEDAGEDDDEGEQACGAESTKQPQRRSDQAAALGDADAEHGDQHRAQRREAGEVRDHVGQDAVQSGDGEQAHRLDRLSRARVDGADAEPVGNAGNKDHQQRHAGEQRRRMGKRVPDILDDTSIRVMKRPPPLASFPPLGSVDFSFCMGWGFRGSFSWDQGPGDSRGASPGHIRQFDS